jgi:hypothetical protein
MIRRLLLGLCLLLSAPLAFAQMYKCVDANGVTHYTDKPRPDCKGGKVDIQSSPTTSGKPAGGAPAGDFARQDADFKRRQIQREQAEARDEAALKQRCARLRQEHEWLSFGGRISKRDAQGQRVYVEDAERQTRLAQVKSELRTCP